MLNMNYTLTINWRFFEKIWKKLTALPTNFIVIMLSIEASALAIAFSYFHKIIIAYGDAESHLNISKRVVHSLTPGIAQLGGIWLPMPHILMLPFVYFDPLWRSGLAGSLVSGVAFVISCLFLYRTTLLLTESKLTSFVAFVIFATNPNMLYMQSTPMTELPLIAFFILSTYYFIKFIKDTNNFIALTLASFFGFAASLTRYDGWFLVMFEAMIIVFLHIKRKPNWNELQGKIILYCTLAFFGIALWMLWDYLILGDAFYFTTSQFSAKAQQQAWLARGELPAYHNLALAFAYYFFTAMSNTGVIVLAIAIVGLWQYLKDTKQMSRIYVLIIMSVPFIFNVFTMFLGQSVIFIPSLTPTSFEWRLFNVRYGVMLIPFVAFLLAYSFHRSGRAARFVIVGLLLFQFALFGIGYSRVISLADGTEGLSRYKQDYAEVWFTAKYDGGLVLIDDYARTISIIHTNVKMQDIIYIGTKPYWEISLERPEKYARWIVMQRDDLVWSQLYNNPRKQKELYKYFEKAYTSPNVLIFKRIDTLHKKN